MNRGSRLIFGIITAGIFFMLSIAVGAIATEKTEEKKDDIPKFFVPKPPPSGSFPCSKCHTYRAIDKKKRKLELSHTGITLKHAEEQRWCYDCHEGDKLRLQNGQLIDFEKSYLLCGQCHGTIFRDWKAGIHGKRTGLWDGEKVYRLCVSCHDPHQPKYKPIEPKEPPIKPADIKLKK
ncbi:MAG: hypothetical protein HY957_06905 [Nitrospirae bacterium]|nr:hypothetical protein [Nitrospirota bacterium]